jgi:hypothetical protein
MSRLNLSGQVFYADLTPAVNANVVIKDLDIVRNDTILTRTTDIEGKFSGRSTEWKDEGIADVLLLQFTVTMPGFNAHSGPFVIIGNGSAPIILPFNPAKPVAKANRVLVQVITLKHGFTGSDESLYNFIEQFSQEVTNNVLGDDYQRIHVLHNTNATLANFIAKLTELGNRASVKAIDVMINTHGSTNKIWFFESPEPDGVPENEVRNALLALDPNVRAKLRAFFSTACMGETVSNKMISGGFKVAMGSMGIYADSETSLFPMLDTWSQGKTFKMSIDAANNVLNVASDEAARIFYRRSADPVIRALADNINSFRNTRGNTDLRIYSNP